VSTYGLGRDVLAGHKVLEREWEDAHDACKKFGDKDSCEAGAVAEVLVA